MVESTLYEWELLLYDLLIKSLKSCYMNFNYMHKFVPWEVQTNEILLYKFHALVVHR